MKSGKIGHFAKADPFENLVSFGPKLKLPKTRQKSLYNHITVDLCKKAPRKNSQYSKNDKLLKSGKIGHFAKANPFENLVSFGPKLKLQKHAKNHSRATLQLIYAKGPLDKTANILKNDKHSKSRKICHFAKANPFENLVSFGPKLKLPKTRQKSLYNHITVDLCKKAPRKNSQYSKNDKLLKSGKIGHFAKANPFENLVSFGPKLKLQKHAKNHSRATLQLIYAKGPLDKAANILKNDKHSKSRKICHFAKANPFENLVSFGPKLKVPKTCHKSL